MAEAHQDGRARRRGLVAALQLLARLDQAEGLGGLDAQRLEHLGREHLADAAFQREAAVAAARPGRAAAAFGAEIEQAAVSAIVQLRKQEAAAVAEIGVVGAGIDGRGNAARAAAGKLPGRGWKRPKWSIHSASVSAPSPTRSAQRWLR